MLTRLRTDIHMIHNAYYNYQLLPMPHLTPGSALPAEPMSMTTRIHHAMSAPEMNNCLLEMANRRVAHLRYADVRDHLPD